MSDKRIMVNDKKTQKTPPTSADEHVHVGPSHPPANAGEVDLASSAYTEAAS